jgi:RNA polymerase sigma factor (sigma-70 family)
MYEELTDDQLLTLSATDGDAFGAFYERHAQSVLAYATRRLGGPEAGAEVTAETFACALAGLKRFRPDRGPAAAWLYGIARHQIARTLERGAVEQRYRRRLGVPRLELTEDEIERIEELAEREGAEIELHTALAELPEEQRAPLHARVVEERSYTEIAQELYVTPAAARKRVSRALAVLRSKLGVRA